MSIISPAAERITEKEKPKLSEQAETEKIEGVRLSYVQPHEVTEEDVKWIKVVIAEMYTKPTLKMIGSFLMAGSLMLWRVSGEAKGIFLLTFSNDLTGRELGIYGLAGDKILSFMDYFDERLAEIGRAAQCRWITAYTLNKRTAKRYEERLGYKILSQFQVKDLGNEHILKL